MSFFMKGFFLFSSRRRVEKTVLITEGMDFLFFCFDFMELPLKSSHAMNRSMATAVTPHVRVARSAQRSAAICVGNTNLLLTFFMFAFKVSSIIFSILYIIVQFHVLTKKLQVAFI